MTVPNKSKKLTIFACNKGRGFPDVENDVQFGKVYIRIDGDDDELEKLRDTLKKNKAQIRGEIENKPWGLKELTVVDPDGVSSVFPLQSDLSSRGCCLADLTVSQNVIIFNQRIKNFQMPANPNFVASSKG